MFAVGVSTTLFAVFAVLNNYLFAAFTVGVYVIGVLNAKCLYHLNNCSLNVLPPSPTEPVFTLYLLIPTMHKKNLRNLSEKRHLPLKLDFVRVGGRYRVGKLLGSGGSSGPKF